MMNTSVDSIDIETRRITLADGSHLQADLIIGADGPQGITRKLMTAETEKTPVDGCVMYE